MTSNEPNAFTIFRCNSSLIFQLATIKILLMIRCNITTIFFSNFVTSVFLIFHQSSHQHTFQGHNFLLFFFSCMIYILYFVLSYYMDIVSTLPINHSTLKYTNVFSYLMRIQGLIYHITQWPGTSKTTCWTSRFEKFSSLSFAFLCFIFNIFLYPPYPKDRGMLWFYVKAARHTPPAARRPPPAMVLTR